MNFSFLNEIILSLLLGFVQGFSEFLPISSTAHMRLASDFLIHKDIGTSISNVIQLGTLLAVIQYFWKDLQELFFHSLKILRGKRKFKILFQSLKKWISSKELQLVSKDLNPEEYEEEGRDVLLFQIALGTIPILIVGFFFKDSIDFIREDIRNIAYFLIAGSVLIAIAEFVYLKFGKKKIETFNETPKITDNNFSSKDSDPDFKEFNPLEVLLIGIFQSLAVFPGISRSGSTMSGALLVGKNRAAAVRFSFLLSIPSIMIAGFLDFFDILTSSEKISLLPNLESWSGEMINLSWLGLFIGFVSSYIFGILFLTWLLDFLRKNSNFVFIVYRIILAAFILGVSFF